MSANKSQNKKSDKKRCSSVCFLPVPGRFWVRVGVWAKVRVGGWVGSTTVYLDPTSGGAS